MDKRSTVNSMNTDAVKGIKDITEGLGSEVVIDFVNNSKTAPNLINMLRKPRHLVMEGLFGGALDLNLLLFHYRHLL
jgi:alcohol dehydrogenase, propanol-preferring